MRYKILGIYFLYLFSICQVSACPSSTDTAYISTATPSSLLAQRNITSLLIDAQNRPTQAFKHLLQLDHIKADNLQTILEETQKSWVAVKQGINGKERCDLIDKPAYMAIRPQVLEIAQQLKLFEPQYPLLKNYEYAICLGCFLDCAQERLDSLIQAWKQGIRFNWLIFLGADRPLRNQPGDIEDFPVLRSLGKPLPQTETDMLNYIWERTDAPTDMQQHLQGQIIFVDTLSREGKRASTGDTYRQWLQEFHPAPGLVLAASSPIVWSYQHLVGLNVLGPNYPLDTISYEVAPADQVSVSLIFDTLAKCLYEFTRQSKEPGTGTAAQTR